MGPVRRRGEAIGLFSRRGRGRAEGPKAPGSASADDADAARARDLRHALARAAEALRAPGDRAALAARLETLAAVPDRLPENAQKPLKLAAPLAEILEDCRKRAGPDREVIYIEDGGGDWLTAAVDRPLFETVVRELLDNVFAHAEGWFRITVTSEPVEGAILVRVKDDGRGMTREQFESGGLGLALVRGILAAHGGRLDWSADPGRGTVVSTWWPVPRSPT